MGDPEGIWEAKIRPRASTCRGSLPASCASIPRTRRTMHRTQVLSSPRKSKPIRKRRIWSVSDQPYAFDRQGGTVPSNNVQRYRESLMMSKAELARKAGLSTLTIDRVEAGRACRLDTKRKILLALGLRVSDKAQVFGSAPMELRSRSETEAATEAAGSRDAQSESLQEPRPANGGYES
jgi:DNA-binding XRE family transcriptional regulator